MAVPANHERDGRDHPQAPRLVWRQKSEWILESEGGKYRIEKYAATEDVLEYPGIFRYRILKILSEWYFELAPPETTAEAAKQICEADVSGCQRMGQLSSQKGAP